MHSGLLTRLEGSISQHWVFQFTEGDVHVPGRRSHRKRRNHDSDSESDVSIGQASIELASSHSSDEEDDFDIGPSWEKQLPKNKKIGGLFKISL